ncbi:DUF397 domain-containing protein [Actinomadura barringtoniae]|uniref:DUF397 domain-containing protein n=1 Tax=Actinomadura barringtoniae TaxID=1427535 RepID=A0A939T9K4_9ACTN|nr:DUF397 domain-containing protein [Actinomadura barringtoniae]
MTHEWRKSSRSATDNDKSCVELAGVSGGVAVRDSKAPEDGYIAFVAADWRRFIDQVKADRYG